MSEKQPRMHVAKIERRHGERVYTSYLVRRSVREGKRVRHVTVANVSKLPAAALELLRRALAGETLLAPGEAFRVERSLPHGHVACLLAMARKLELARLLERRPGKERERVLAMICQRLLRPGSKLDCTRALGQSTRAASTTTRRCSRRSRSCAAASGCARSCSSSTAGWSPRPTWTRSPRRRGSPGSRP